MVINVHAGHNPANHVACGAVGFLNESEENRKVKDAVISLLRQNGHTAYDCTCEDGTSVKDVLDKITTKCNEHTVDLDVSIHFNAFENTKLDGKIKGTEVLTYSTKSKANLYAKQILQEMKSLGFTNRGVKYRPDLTYINSTKAPALLIEICFVDDEDDFIRYDNVGVIKIAKAIVRGITGDKLPDTIITNKVDENINVDKLLVRVECESLNVRKGPGTQYPVKTQIRKGEVYTITEISANKWGHLKSGIGWINLKYTRKI